MYAQGLFSLNELQTSFDAIEPELIRFPSLDADALCDKVTTFIQKRQLNQEEETP